MEMKNEEQCVFDWKMESSLPWDVEEHYSRKTLMAATFHHTMKCVFLGTRLQNI